MSDTSVTLPQSAISSVGFLPAGICHLWISRCRPAWTREGLPTEETLMLKSAKTLRKSNLVIKGVMNAYFQLLGSMHIYRLLIMLSHVIGWALVWPVGEPGSCARPFSSIIMVPYGPCGQCYEFVKFLLNYPMLAAQAGYPLTAQAGYCYSFIHVDYLRLWRLFRQVLWL